jgi:hypothetical protein
LFDDPNRVVPASVFLNKPTSEASVITKSKDRLTIGEGGKNKWDEEGGWDIQAPDKGDASQPRKRTALNLPKPKFTGRGRNSVEGTKSLGRRQKALPFLTIILLHPHLFILSSHSHPTASSPNP